MRRTLLVLATLLAFCVVGLGAYVRLSDAGLGCPDWPGCYGHLVGVPDEAHEQAHAEQAFPGKPVHAGKAWKEMIHRYLAGTLGLLIFAVTVLAWRQRIARGQTTALAGLVIFQALLGMWTVTLLLKPMVVTAHLLGGMSTLALLVWLVQRPSRTPQPGLRAPRGLAVTALVVVAIQIALGGWVSSNYAALACQDFPTCQGQWLPAMDFDRAFTLHRELGRTADGALLPFAALTAIHWLHRLGALVVAVVAGGLALSLTGLPAWRRWGLALACLLLLQVGLGIANVLLSLPLPLAVAHNLGAALLLAALVVVNYRLR
jgi:cytochrome c oxidase assembly protein subunit 15